MAPRRQAKHAVESTVDADVNGDATLPKKKKTVAAVVKSAVRETKQTKSGSPRRAKAQEKQISESKADNARLPKRPRGGRTRNTAAVPKATAETKTKSKKISKAEETVKSDDAVGSDNAVEHIPEQVVVKKTRAKTGGTMAKKAGTKERTATKAKAKSPIAKKRKNPAATENGAEDNVSENTDKKDAGGQSPVKRTRAKAVEKENVVAPVARPAVRAPRKRKNTNDEVVTKVGDAQVVEEEKAVPDKKPRSRAKKATDELEVKTKGRAKKSTVKEVAKLSKEIEMERNDHDVAVQEESSKVKNKTNANKGTVKKITSKGKGNVAVRKINNISVKGIAMSEADAAERNEETETAEMVQLKQKRRNVMKANKTTKEKIQTKSRQKKGQTDTISVDETKIAKDKTEVAKDETEMAKDETTEAAKDETTEMAKNEITEMAKDETTEVAKDEAEVAKDETEVVEDATVENDIIAKTDLVSEVLDKINTKDVSSNKSNALEEEEEKNEMNKDEQSELEKSVILIKDEHLTVKMDISIKNDENSC